MAKVFRTIKDCSTGEETQIELTAEEIAEAKLRDDAIAAEFAAKAEAKAALLTRLGITADEAKLLIQ